MAYILPNGRRLSGLETGGFSIGDINYPSAYLEWPGFCESRGIQAVPDTQEEAAEKRAKAYDNEIGGLLQAYQGYLAEGKADEAEVKRLEYVAAKETIRARFPYPEG